jgi:hypothetical protein
MIPWNGTSMLPQQSTDPITGMAQFMNAARDTGLYMVVGDRRGALSLGYQETRPGDRYVNGNYVPGTGVTMADVIGIKQHVNGLMAFNDVFSQDYITVLNWVMQHVENVRQNALEGNARSVDLAINLLVEGIQPFITNTKIEAAEIAPKFGDELAAVLNETAALFETVTDSAAMREHFQTEAAQKWRPRWDIRGIRRTIELAREAEEQSIRRAGGQAVRTEFEARHRELEARAALAERKHEETLVQAEQIRMLEARLNAQHLGTPQPTFARAPEQFSAQPQPRLQRSIAVSPPRSPPLARPTSSASALAALSASSSPPRSRLQPAAAPFSMPASAAAPSRLQPAASAATSSRQG